MSFDFPQQGPSKHLIDCITFPLDDQGVGRLHMGLDPAQDFQCVYRISQDDLQVTMDAMTMDVVMYMADSIVAEIENPDFSGRAWIHANADLDFWVFENGGRNELLIRCEMNGPRHVWLTKDHVKELKELKKTCDRELASKTDRVRPAVLSELNRMVDYFLGQIPPNADIKMIGDLAKWMGKVFGDEDHGFRSGIARQILFAASRQLVERAYMKILQQQTSN